jgi:hypothetical protein
MAYIINAFNYTLLDQSAHDEIRLLGLLPGDKPAPIRRILRIVSHRNAILASYEAVSYTWGNDGRTQTISVNECSFDVTQNLYAALENFRNNSKHELTARMLWIDAICINQDDQEEQT